MDNENLKQLAESLLTYEHGISIASWEVLSKILVDADIYQLFANRVHAVDDVVFIPES
jgi:hypothetical protein